MKKWLIGGVVAFALLIGTILYVSQKPANQPITRTESPKTEVVVYTPEQLLVEANKLRAEKGIAPLKLDERLNKSAQMKADDFKANNYYAHENPVTKKKGASYVLETAPKTCQYASENIEGTLMSQSPFDDWTKSPQHLAAIIDTRYELTGFGYTEFGGNQYYVQHFCDLP
jgi:uncharacterized protein YkwD